MVGVTGGGKGSGGISSSSAARRALKKLTPGNGARARAPAASAVLFVATRARRWSIENRTEEGV